MFVGRAAEKSSVLATLGTLPCSVAIGGARLLLRAQLALPCDLQGQTESLEEAGVVLAREGPLALSIDVTAIRDTSPVFLIGPLSLVRPRRQGG